MTDVDVFAAAPDEFVGARRLLIDCKTGRRESPINRSVWLRGLMDMLAADRGMCILKAKAIEPDHRYAAGLLGITLLREQEFEDFSGATSREHGESVGAVGAIENWECFQTIPQQYPALTGAVRFSASDYWMCRTRSEACRKTLILLRNIKGELDPAKPQHLALVCDLAALFMLALAELVQAVFASFLKPSSREALSEALLQLLYGGKDAYDHRVKLVEWVAKAAPAIDISAALHLPEWERFVQLARQLLDAPLEASCSPLQLRELALMTLARDPDAAFLRRLAQESPQGGRFAVLGLEYLCRATELPAEFSSILGDQLVEAQAPD